MDFPLWFCYYFLLGYIHALLHLMVILCFCSGRPKILGDYLKEKVSLFILKISCNYKVIYSFTISFYYFIHEWASKSAESEERGCRRGRLKGGQSNRKSLVGCQGQGPWGPRQTGHLKIVIGKNSIFAAFSEKDKGLSSRGLLRFFKSFVAKVADVPFFFNLLVS